MTFGNALIDFKEEKTENDVYYYGYQVVREFNKETNCWDIVKRDKSITQKAFVEKKYKKFYDDKRKKLEDEEHDRKYAFDFFKTLIDVDKRITGVGIYDGNKMV